MLELVVAVAREVVEVEEVLQVVVHLHHTRKMGDEGFGSTVIRVVVHHLPLPSHVHLVSDVP